MRILPALLTLAAVSMPVAASAQSHCADREVVTERLSAKYGESFAGGGLRNSDAIFEVWKSTENGTWTIIMTMPNGKSCVMAAGTDWRDGLPKVPAGIPG
mgnify:CR=1 FL=1